MIPNNLLDPQRTTNVLRYNTFEQERINNPKILHITTHIYGIVALVYKNIYPIMIYGNVTKKIPNGLFILL